MRILLDSFGCSFLSLDEQESGTSRSLIHGLQCEPLVYNTRNPLSSVIKTRWTPEFIARLGKEADKDIAASLGLTISAAGIRRRLLGIPPLEKPKPKWTRRMISKLGKVPDAMIAKSFGIGYLAVVAKRRDLGIAGFRGK